MKNNDNKEITINFDYKTQLITIKTNPFKQLFELKKIAVKKINIMNNINISPEQINCYYLGRNLNDYELQKICELFSNREIITIKLKSPKKNLTLDNNLSNSNNNNIIINNISTTPNASPIRGKNYFSNFFKNTNVFSSGFNSISRIKKDKNSLMYQIFTERLKNKNSLLPVINPKISRNNSNSSNKINKSDFDNNYYIPSKKEYNENLINGIGIICGKCNEYYITEYCRTCNDFICSECKENNEHNNHLSMQLIKGDLNDNINIYCSLVQTDIEEYINNNNELLSKDKIINIIDDKTLIGKNEDLIHKLESLIKMYQNILEILKNNCHKDSRNKMNLLIQNFVNGANQINEEINLILNDVNSNYDKKFDFKKIKSYFDKINVHEIKLSQLNKDLIKFHLSSKINIKIDSLYSKLNKILDGAIDIKNLFYLEPKYYNELIKLISFDKNKNGFNRIKYKTSKFLDLNISHDNSEINEKNNSSENKEKGKRQVEKNKKEDKKIVSKNQKKNDKN